MNEVTIKNNFTISLYGFSGVALNKDYVGTAFQLMDKMWKTIAQEQLKHKGVNIWVYEPDEKVFAGVQLYEPPQHASYLEQKSIDLIKYAYYKHIGPYKLIKDAGQFMRDELRAKGLKTKLPYIEIYGHWTNDETKLETELLMSLE